MSAIGIPCSVTFSVNRSKEVRILDNGSVAPIGKWYLNIHFHHRYLPIVRDFFQFKKEEDMRFIGAYQSDHRFLVSKGAVGPKGKLEGYLLTAGGNLQWPNLSRCAIKDPGEYLEMPKKGKPFQFSSVMEFDGVTGTCRLSPELSFDPDCHDFTPLRDTSGTIRVPSTTGDPDWSRGVQKIDLPKLMKELRPAEKYVDGTRVINQTGSRYGDFLIIYYIRPGGIGANGGKSNMDFRWPAICINCGHEKQFRGKKFEDCKCKHC
jgi:hypothetical protein